MRNGVVDMRACIRRRVVRREREWQMEDNDEEVVIMESMKQSPETWLFLNSPKDVQVYTIIRTHNIFGYYHASIKLSFFELCYRPPDVL